MEKELKINIYEAELLASVLRDAIEVDSKKPWFETKEKQIAQMHILLKSIQNLHSATRVA
tara:strand:- start:129 stop:308 length:180 start_codon:yes stop_codon:yes gene_type:complete